MRFIAFCTVCVVCWASSVAAADLVSGTWTTGTGPEARTYVFKVTGDRFTGILCGPCDNPSSVFRIEDGRILGADKVSFFVRYDVGGPAFGRLGPYRERVEAVVARNALTLAGRPESDAGAALTTTSLTRVVENFELGDRPLPAPPPSTGGAVARASSIQGRWVSPGRAAQQNWILKVQNDQVWGLVCGPCTPAVVAMVDGRIDGETITFYINHIDTPPSPTRQGIQRNVMTATLPEPGNTNLMRFKWVSEQSPSQTGEIVMVGPVIDR